MSRMVSRWKSSIQNREIRGYMYSDGSIHYSFMQFGLTKGNLLTEEKEEMISSGLYTEIFNNEASSKEEFEILGFLL